jgi:hypothetical protein
VKEPIIFKWKLIGTSNNMTLTLFKAVEREDVDAQYERTQREGYYTDLKILDADAKVDQPAQPKGTKKESPRAERGGKGASSSDTERSCQRSSSSDSGQMLGQSKPREGRRIPIETRRQEKVVDSYLVDAGPRTIADPTVHVTVGIVECHATVGSAGP